MLTVDTNYGTEQKVVSFGEDHEEFCKRAYDEAMQRNDDLRDINIANRNFYEGRDDDLEERAADKDVVRSSLFIHELKPAIDTRVSDIVAKLREREYPITFRPDVNQPDNDTLENATWVEREITKQLRECGYLDDGFRAHVESSEIYRSPSAVKVGWEYPSEKVARTEQPTWSRVITAMTMGMLPPKPKVVWRDKYPEGRPYVELLPPDQLLYQPNVPELDDCEYTGHPIWVSYDRLMAMANENKWDTAKIKAYRDEMAAQEEDKDSDNDTFEEDMQEERDQPVREGFRDGKFLVAEMYVPQINEHGNEIVWQVVTVGNKYAVSKKMTPYRGLRHPFVTLTANPFPGSIEGLSSIDIAKNMQKLYNELFNQFLDGTTYRTFPPLLREPGTQFKKRPKWAPGQIWDVTNPEGLRPLIENPGPMPDLPALMKAVSSKIREVLNAHDISQGFQSQEYEKATSTSLRAQGSEKRAMPTRKRYGDALIAVAYAFLVLNQQYHPQQERFAQPFIIDVPSLTNMSDPEAQKQESMLLLTQAQQSPLYQTPTGQRKLRNLTEDVVRAFKKTDIERYVPTEEELEADITAKTNLEIETLKKQSAHEQLGIEAAQGARQ